MCLSHIETSKRAANECLLFEGGEADLASIGNEAARFSGSRAGFEVG